MKSILKAVYRRLGRPSRKKVAVAGAAGLVAAVVLVGVALFGDTRLVSSLTLLMSLVTLGAVVVAWNESHRARVEMRASTERAEVTYRRILAAIEVERLAAERRHAGVVVPTQDQNR